MSGYLDVEREIFQLEILEEDTLERSEHLHVLDIGGFLQSGRVQSDLRFQLVINSVAHYRLQIVYVYFGQNASDLFYVIYNLKEAQRNNSIDNDDFYTSQSHKIFQKSCH